MTLWNVNATQLINITNVTLDRQINIEVPNTVGVAIIRDSIYFGSNKGEVSIINLINGKCLKTELRKCTY